MWRPGILFGIVAAALLLAALACGGANGEPEPTASPTQPEASGDGLPHNPLLSDTRSRLSVCVAGTEGQDISDAEVDEVRDALEAGFSDVSDVPVEFNDPEVVADCPPPVVPPGTPADFPGLGAPKVDEPSDHMIFVYFLTDEIFEVTFGEQPYSVSPEEFVCRFDDCEEVTLGLYVPASVSSTVLEDGLLYAFHLRPREPIPEPTFHWENCERGTPPHPDYNCERYEEWKRNQAGQN